MALDRQRYSTQERGRKKGVTHWNSNQMSPIREYPCKCVPLYPLSITLSPALKAKPSIPAHFCWHASTAQEEEKKRKKEKAWLFVCGGHWDLTLDARLHVAARKKTKDKARQEWWYKVKLKGIRNAEPDVVDGGAGLISCLSSRRAPHVAPLMALSGKVKQARLIQSVPGYPCLANERGVTQRRNCPPRETGRWRSLNDSGWKHKIKIDERGEIER